MMTDAKIPAPVAAIFGVLLVIAAYQFHGFWSFVTAFIGGYVGWGGLRVMFGRRP